MVDAVIGRAGGIDILVNNAAVFDMAPLLEITPGPRCSWPLATATTW